MALGDSRSPDPAGGQDRDHLTEFTPLFLSEQGTIPEESTVSAVRTHRSSSVGNIEMPRSAPLARRVSDATANDNTVQPLPQQRAITPPLTLPTRSEDHQQILTLSSPEPVVSTALSTNQSSSSRSLNTSFIDGPPVADSSITREHCSSNRSSPTTSRRNSPVHGNSPVLGNSPLPPQQEHGLSDNLRVDPRVDTDSLREYAWFHGMISRMDAALLVTQNGENGTGEFLIRQSESRAGDLVLSFNYHGRAKVTKLKNLCIKHFTLIIAHSI